MNNRLYIFSLCMVIFFKLALVSHFQLFAIGGSNHDDQLFLNLASRLLATGWFGPYSEMTLAKGLGYPIFIAANFLIGLPLLFTQQIFYAMAGLVLLHAVSGLGINRKWLVVLFALYLFNPATYFDGSHRVLRMGIYPALTVLALSGAIGLMAGRRRSIGGLYGWGALLGIFWGWFWITREEGVWMMPSLMLILASTGIFMFREKNDRRDLILRLGSLVFPLVLWGLILGGISTVNGIVYGIYATNEFKHPAFLSAYGALCRVKHPNRQPYLPAPKEVRALIYEASPAFRELEPHLEQKGFFDFGCPIYPHTCGDIAAGWFMWAFREATAGAGYYDSGEKAVAYYRRLADEINDACREGRLECGPKRASMRPPMRSEYLVNMPERVIRAVRMLIGFTPLSVRSQASTGDAKQFHYFHDITHSLINPPINKYTWEETSVVGRLYQDGFKGIPEMRPASGGRDILDYTIHFSPIEDPVNQPDTDRAGPSGFAIRAVCPEPCTLRFYRDDALFFEVPADKKGVYHLEGLYLEINMIKKRHLVKGYFNSRDLTGQTRLARVKTRILSRIVTGYQMLVPVIFVPALIGYVISLVCLFRRRISLSLIVNTALLGATAARVLVLVLIETTSFPAVNWVYMSPAAPLLLIFIVLSIKDGLDQIGYLFRKTTIP